MARKGKVMWEVSRELRSEGQEYVGVQHYALREDGVLLGRYQMRNLDGSGRYDWGWKVATRKPKADALAVLRAKGFA
jgi:hypothetical protein